MNALSKKIQIYSVQISDSKHEFSFQTELHKLEETVLVELPTPKYLGLQNKYQHLEDLEINNNDPKAVLLAHIILGVKGYTKIKTQERPRLGLEGEPVAELTKLGWAVVSPGNNSEVTNLWFSKTSLHNYENLCSLTCLGIEKIHVRLMISCMINSINNEGVNQRFIMRPI